MEQANNVALNLLQAVASQTQPPKTSQGDGDGEFQKLMDKAKTGQPDGEVQEQPKAETPAAKKENAAQKKEEDPVETFKRLQAYLAPVSPEELSQYPASWLPKDLEEGERIVCVGVTTGKNGEQIPILVGENTANKMFGKQIVAPPELMEQYQQLDVADPEADAMLEATDPAVEHGPARMLEKLAEEAAGVEEEKKPELFQTREVRPDGDRDGDADTETEVEVTDVDQGPRQLFHDVKAAPVKVGEAYRPEQAEKADVARQVDTGLAQALEKGESMVRIQLTPENLGSVTVEITRSAEGIIRVALSAHSGETRGLLERHAGELQGLLTSRTQQTVEVEVQRQQESQQGQNQQNPYDGRNGHGQSGQEERRHPRREHSGSSQDFMQQLRLGLIPADE